MADDRTNVRRATRGFRYAEHIPYQVPRSLDGLRGPTRGMVRVGPPIDTSLDPVYDLADAARLRNLYARVIREGTVADQQTLINGAKLVRLWPELTLPPECRALWERQFPLLAERAREARTA